jgi:hypothetical protein
MMRNNRGVESRLPDQHHYQIRLKGHIDDRWSDWFDGMTVSQRPGGTTLLSGPVADQAALHGLLGKINNLGLPLLSVISDQETEPTAEQASGQCKEKER